MTYLEEPYLIIRWDETLKCVHMQWRGFVEGEKFRAGLDKGLELLKEKKAQRWLADLEQLRVVSLSDQDWMTKNWLPRATASGLRFTANVLPESVIAQMVVNRIKVNAKDDGAAYFDDMEKAREWLSAQSAEVSSK